MAGKDNWVADALFRAALPLQQSDMNESEETDLFVNMVVDFDATPKRLLELRQAQETNEVC